MPRGLSSNMRRKRCSLSRNAASVPASSVRLHQHAIDHDRNHEEADRGPEADQHQGLRVAPLGGGDALAQHQAFICDDRLDRVREFIRLSPACSQVLRIRDSWRTWLYARDALRQTIAIRGDLRFELCDEAGLPAIVSHQRIQLVQLACQVPLRPLVGIEELPVAGEEIAALAGSCLLHQSAHLLQREHDRLGVAHPSVRAVYLAQHEQREGAVGEDEEECHDQSGLPADTAQIALPGRAGDTHALGASPRTPPLPRAERRF
jgi:hypothetical protein